MSSSPIGVFEATLITETVFGEFGMLCEATYYYVPALCRWELWTDIEYKYFNTKDRVVLDNEFMRCAASFFDDIVKITKKFKKEFDLYFNPLWC